MSDILEYLNHVESVLELPDLDTLRLEVGLAKEDFDDIIYEDWEDHRVILLDGTYILLSRIDCSNKECIANARDFSYYIAKDDINICANCKAIY